MAASGGGSFLTLWCAGAIQNQHVSQTTACFGVPHNHHRKRKTPHRLVVVAVTQGSAESNKSDEKIPSWAKPDSDEPPPWARDESNNNTSQQGVEIPFFAYLLASAITAIAAVSNQFTTTIVIVFYLFLNRVSFAITDWIHFRICKPKTGLRSINIGQHVLCSLAWFFCLHWHSLFGNIYFPKCSDWEFELKIINLI